MGDVGYPLCTERTPTKVVLPLALQYLTPKAVAFFGLGAVSAAVMSSTDSSMLSASTMIARNFYQKVIRPNCSEKEVIWALWVCIIINCVIATSLAITYRSIYDLFVLCGDFMFVIVFPQLTLVLYWELANTYGSVFSFVVGLVRHCLPPAYAGSLLGACQHLRLRVLLRRRPCSSLSSPSLRWFSTGSLPTPTAPCSPSSSALFS